MKGVAVRAEESTDHEAVAKINERAFGGPDEARLVDALRGGGHRMISLVAVLHDEVVGHILFTPVFIEAQHSRSPAMALGPMAVEPRLQKQGVGSALVRAGLEACQALREPVVFVLGHPGYYPRFGFQPAGPSGLHYQSEALDPAFMVAELEPGALAGRSGWVKYLAEFDDV